MVSRQDVTLDLQQCSHKLKQVGMEGPRNRQTRIVSQVDAILPRCLYENVQGCILLAKYSNLSTFGPSVPTIVTGFELHTFAQCTFLVADVQICQSPDFVTSMSSNPSNYSLHLRT